MSKEFDNILDECLERILAKGETVEQCLQSFPRYAEELKPLLETAVTASQVSAIQPRPEFREKARYQLQVAFREMEEKKSRSIFNWGWQPRWAPVAITVAIVLLLSGGGTVAAASGSMPDDALYLVKLATEQARLVFSFSEVGKAEFYAELVDKRVNEIVYLAEENKPEQIEQTAERLNEHLVAMAALPSPKGEAYEAAMTREVEEELALDTGEEEEALPEITGEEEQEEAEEKITITEPPGEKEDLEAAEPPPPEVIVVEKEPKAAMQFSGGAGANVAADRWTNLNITIANQASMNSARLRKVMETAPESARQVLEKAISNLETNYRKAMEALNEP